VETNTVDCQGLSVSIGLSLLFTNISIEKDGKSEAEKKNLMVPTTTKG
jgi:hypothetical protein